MTNGYQLSRRRLLGVAGASAGGLALGGCGSEPEARYNAADVELLARQRAEEAAASGEGPSGAMFTAVTGGLRNCPGSHWMATAGWLSRTRVSPWRWTCMPTSACRCFFAPNSI